MNPPADPKAPPSPQRLREIRQAFGKDSWRPGQAELISKACSGVSCLGVLPTGHGKSLCYQAAAELLGGLSLVVSPLIALMRDQIRALEAAGIPAARFDSTLNATQRSSVLERVASGQLRLLFAAPESLESPQLVEALARAELSLFVVDEAHCVSEWGHSFRPDYLKLPQWQRRFAFRSTMALTATATPRVREDLCRAFSIAAQDVICLSPYRPNIERRVQVITPGVEIAGLLETFLKEPQHLPAILYTRTRQKAETLAAELSRRGFRCAAYHAGQPAELRQKLQDAFLHNRLELLVATIAFGMGIDKPDVRAVVHVQVPGSPEAYLQESGRAGRDGSPSVSLVLLHQADVVDARNRIEAALPDAEGVLRCVRWLLPAVSRVVSLWELSTTCDIPEDVPLRALSILQQQGAITCESRGMRFYKVRPLFPLDVILDGREAAETDRLRWLEQHREGEVAEAADAWHCNFAEAMEQLRECEASGEWSLRLRQQALSLRATGRADARAVAEALCASFAARREAELERLDQLLHILCSATCLNDALEHYFMNRPLSSPCGTCRACRTARPLTLPEANPPPAPPAAAATLPDLARDRQRRRFLLGICSPGLMARRLWSHPLYGSRAGTPWQDL